MNLKTHVAAAMILTLLPPVAFAQGVNPKMYAGMSWRSIGPYRGGRTRALAGIPSQPNVFFVGAVNGGVWKTDDYGRTWKPLFDREDTGSVGAIAIAPSNADIIYVGSGEGLQRPDLSVGDGIYKSIDGGQKWTHLGLRNGQQIPQIAVDPRDPNRLFVAVLGHPYGPNEERGIFRSTDGGASFQKVLYKDANTGGCDVKLDPSNPDTVYAALWEARQGPWENAAWSGTGGGIFKSTDGGSTWRPLTRGLPSGADGVVQANLAIAPSQPSRLFASIATMRGTAIYRSDDAGESWARATTDTRPAQRIGGGDLAVPTVSPQNANIVYSASVVTWKSTDGGKTWTGLRGAPGGDDYQSLWINPHNPETMLGVSDQGALVTVNGGQTWSSWFNQPTAQMYHAAADNAYPYRVCSGQQESGSACVASRGNDGEITFRDWHPVGVEEYGFAAPDPLDPDIVYGGKVTRYDRRTGQVENVSPKPVRTADYRTVRTAPLLFSPIDPHTLYFAANTLWKTRDGGQNWQQISPDLTRKSWEAPSTVGIYAQSPTAKPTQRGVIYALGLSPVSLQRLWAGTDDGLIQTTADGGTHWSDVTPAELKPFMKVSIVEAGHFDGLTAYAAINTLRLDDMTPHILRTHDGGKHWTEIIGGLPDNAPVDVVREDPKRKGLLYAGTERAVFVSFDDGDHWQPLRRNMPATSIRDLIIKDDDLIAATHGRGFWILDNVTPLRQASAAVENAAAFLFKPQTAIRVRWDMNTDTPIPPDEAAGQNPPDGAMLDYYLGPGVSGTVTLEVLDSAGKLVRKYSSSDPIPEIDPELPIPKYWVRRPEGLSAEPGMHRFLWDMHYPRLPEARPNYPMQAVVENTAPAPDSPWVMPGNYMAKLTVDGKSYTQPFAVKMDPRVKTPTAGLQQQFTVSYRIYQRLQQTRATLEQMRGMRTKLRQMKDNGAAGPAGQAAAAFDEKLAAMLGSAGFFGGRGGAPGPDTFSSLNAALGSLMGMLQEADMAPTPTLVRAVAGREQAMTKLEARWKALLGELPALNARLREAGMAPLAAAPIN